MNLHQNLTGLKWHSARLHVHIGLVDLSWGWLLLPHSWLVDKSILPILPCNPYRRRTERGGDARSVTHYNWNISKPGVYFVLFFTFFFFFYIWFGFHPSSDMTIRTVRPDRVQHFRPRMHCLSKVGGCIIEYKLLIIIDINFTLIINIVQDIN